MKDLAEITLIDNGIFAYHDMPCAVCMEKPAVYWCNQGIFDPCWDCQSKGWMLKRPLWQTIKSWFK